jgi:hypothetical protein
MLGELRGRCLSPGAQLRERAGGVENPFSALR